jgi:hypothetical protein
MVNLVAEMKNDATITQNCRLFSRFDCGKSLDEFWMINLEPRPFQAALSLFNELKRNAI